MILHADMDAFYASVEQRDQPELRGKPVIVGGTGNRGVVSAASYEAREFGVHSAQPTVVARRLCPDGVFLRGSMQRYQAESRRIFEIFRRFTPLVEGLSLDEAFLDLKGTERLHGTPREAGERLRREVRADTGLAVSVGIAPIKMIAKLASDAAKPDGLLEVQRDAVRDFLEPLPVGRLWGVGPVAQARIHAAGFRVVGDLTQADPHDVEQLLGDWGLAIARLGRGEDVREVEAYREAISYSEENTFSEDVSDPRVIDATLLTHADSVARRLRRDGLRARTVMLKLKLARRQSPGPRGYPLRTRQRTLPEPSDDGDAIGATACALRAEADLREAVRLVGVGVTGLEPADRPQLSLFAPSETRKRRDSLNRALDEIADRFGSDAVVRAARGASQRAGLSLQRKRGEGEEEAEPS